MPTIIQDLRFAFRWLRRSPGFASIAAASIAVAIGIYTALFAVVDAVLLRPLPVHAPDRLVSLYTSGSDGEPWNTTSYPDLTDLRAQNAVFEDMAGHSAMIAAVSVGERSRLALGEIVTGNYFQVLGVTAALGRTLQPADDRPGAERVVMVSDRYWRRELGRRDDAVGSTIRMRGQTFTIVGVVPPGFTSVLAIVSPDLWVAAAHAEEVEPAGIIDVVPSPGGRTRIERRGYRWLFVTARLRPGVSIEQARANVDGLMRGLAAAHVQTNKDRRASMVPTSSLRLHPQADRALRIGAAGLMIAVGLVLLVACANVAGMLLARASARQKEISVRLAIGATRGRLVRQLVTESILLALVGAAGGLFIAWVLTRAVTALQLPIPIPLTLSLGIDGRAAAFGVLASVLAGVLAGIMPAVRVSGTDLATAMKGGAVTATRVGRFRWSLRDTMVAAQIAVTAVLVVTAGLLGRSLIAMQRTDVGFRTGGLAIVSTDVGMLRYDEVRARLFFDRALERLRALPGVESAALAARLPFSINFNVEQFHVPGVPSPDDRGFAIQNTRVSPEYFRTLGIPIVEGRGFTTADTPDSPRVIVVNETLARRFWPGESAVGRRLHLRNAAGPAFEIVGVAANHKVGSVGEAPQPYVHFAQTQRPDTYQVILARTGGDPARLLADLRRELLSLEPNLVFLDNQTMDAQVALTMFPTRATAWLVSVVGGIGLLLAAVGLYGVIAYAVTRRTREIGTRMALGAQRSQVVGLVMGHGFVVTAAGLLAGLALAALAVRAIGGVLYGISAADPIAWAGATVMLLASSSLANLIPALRAARVDPLTALRIE
jgi:predicted permease